MKVGWKDAFWYTLSALFAAGLLFVLFRKVDWTEFISILGKCSWGYVILGMLVGVLEMYVRGLRWQMLLTPIDPSTKKGVAYDATAIGMAVNLALPRMGELVRCGVITANSRRDESGRKKASYDKVLGTMVIDRGWDVVSLLILLLLTLALMWGKIGAFFSGTLLPLLQKNKVLWITLAVVAAVAIVMFSVYGRSRERGSKVGAALGRFVSGLMAGLKSCLKMEKSWKFFIYTIIIWGGYWVMSLSILWALKGIDPSSVSADLGPVIDRMQSLNAADALFLTLAGALSSLIPVPGGFGAFHSMVALSLSTVYGIPVPFGLIFATLSHESQTLVQLLCGGEAYLSESVRRRRNKDARS